MKNAVAYKNKNMYLKITIYLNQAFTFPLMPVLPIYRNHSIDLQSKSIGQFLYNGDTV